MKIKDLDELEICLNEIGTRLNQVESLSKILLDCLYENYDLKPQDIQNFTSVLGNKIAQVKEKFNIMEEELIFNPPNIF